MSPKSAFESSIRVTTENAEVVRELRRTTMKLERKLEEVSGRSNIPRPQPPQRASLAVYN